MLALSLGLALQTTAGGSQNPPPKPTPAVQSLLDQAAKLQPKDQISVLQQAADLAHSTKDVVGELLALNREGNDCRILGQNSRALELFNEALIVCTAASDRLREAGTLGNIGLVYEGLSQYAKALEATRRALSIYRQIGDRTGEAHTLADIGFVYDRLSDFTKALDFLKQAIPIQRQVGDRHGEAGTLMHIGIVYGDLSQNATALEYFEQALPILHQLGDQPGEAGVLMDIGIIYEVLSEHAKALQVYQRALPIQRQVGDRNGEANNLTNIGVVYVSLSNFAAALDVLQQALPLRQQIGDIRGEAATLTELGIVFEGLSRYAKALEYFQSTLPIFHQVGDQVGEAMTDTEIANVYSHLTQYTKALESYALALQIERKIDDRGGEVGTLTGLGNAYVEQSQYGKALQVLQQAVPICRQVGDREGEVALLTGIGNVYRHLSQSAKALRFFEQALLICRQISDRSGEAGSLSNIATVYLGRGNAAIALKYYAWALPLSRAANDRPFEANILDGLTITLRMTGQKPLAIALGKQEINVLESIRADNKSLEMRSQVAYRQSVSDRYRRVAGWLTDVGRLAEAEQVLDLLKDEEYFRFLRRRAGGGAEKLNLTPREAKWLGAYEKLGEDFAALATRRETLIKIGPPLRTPAQKAELSKLDGSVGKAQAAFQSFLAEVREAFKDANLSDDKRLDDLEDAHAIQKALTNLPGHPEAIYTFSAGDTVRVIVTAAGGAPLARQAPKKISSEELNRKVLAFRAAVTDPRLDPRPLGAELYDLLVRPIEHDLEAGKADVLMWNLDGVLRYVPLAALYDDKTNQFLIEKYPCSIFTPRTVERLTEVPKPGGAAGFGVSKAGKVNDVELAALPSVPGEIAAVKGALGGSTYDLDEKFTAKAFEDSLHDQPHIVHIATHFHFQLGDAEDSFLLLGDNQTLTVAQINDLPDDTFASIDTLTLSACQTALGGDGGEFESFALLAQQKGAGAVLASLWSVSDESTALLMGEFYRLRRTHPKWTKLAALRSAQLEMLHGQIGGTGDASEKRSASDINVAKSEAPPWPKDRPRFSHPYYWAPFVLTGNWR